VPFIGHTRQADISASHHDRRLTGHLSGGEVVGLPEVDRASVKQARSVHGQCEARIAATAERMQLVYDGLTRWHAVVVD